MDEIELLLTEAEELGGPDGLEALQNAIRNLANEAASRGFVELQTIETFLRNAIR